MESSIKIENNENSIPKLYQFIPKDERGLTQQSIDFLNTTLGRDKVRIILKFNINHLNSFSEYFNTTQNL